MSPIHHGFKKGASKDNRLEERLRLATNRVPVFLWERAEGEEPLKTFCFLSEVSNSGVGLFADKIIPAATSLRIAFEAINGPTYRATVVWSNRYSLNQKFIGHESLSYRLGIRLHFVTEAERQRYLKFVEELKARALTIEHGMKF